MLSSTASASRSSFSRKSRQEALGQEPLYLLHQSLQEANRYLLHQSHCQQELRVHFHRLRIVSRSFLNTSASVAGRPARSNVILNYDQPSEHQHHRDEPANAHRQPRIRYLICFCFCLSCGSFIILLNIAVRPAIAKQGNTNQRPMTTNVFRQPPFLPIHTSTKAGNGAKANVQITISLITWPKILSVEKVGHRQHDCHRDD